MWRQHEIKLGNKDKKETNEKVRTANLIEHICLVWKKLVSHQGIGHTHATIVIRTKKERKFANQRIEKIWVRHVISIHIEIKGT